MKYRTAIIVITALGSSACSDPRQIILSIDTTAGIPCDMDKIRVRATGSKASTYEKSLAGARLPLSITIDDGTDSGNFELQVSGMKGDTEVLRATGALQFGEAGTLAANVVLEPTCTPERPCALPALIPYVAPPAPVASRSECSGAVRRYKTAPTAETYRDVCTVPGANAGKVLTGGARGAALLPLDATALAGFTFDFYGRPIRQIWAHEDGYISFGPNNPDAMNDLDPGSFDRDLLGTGVPPPQQSVMVFWDGLTLGTSGVCYALEGAPGTQKLRVSWTRTCQVAACTSDNLNFSIVLDERTNRISLSYGEMTAGVVERAQGATATSGIVNAATGCPVSQCALATGLCSDGLTPCGYQQLFSKMPQLPRVADVGFEPVVEAD